MSKMKLRWNERLVCRVMSHLRYDKDDWFYECPYNDTLCRISWFLLGGRDPIKFMVQVVEECEDALAELGIK